MRLLLAEDEKELSKALCAALKHNNYSVDAVYNGQDAFDYGIDENYDAIILDIMMPKMNGIEVLAELRRNDISTPVMILTAKSEIDDKISGLDAGADDYMTKPFDMREFLARVRALTRRKSEFSPNLLSFSDISLNRESFELSCKGESIRLGNKEFQMLEMLMTNPARLISTEQFMERIWGYETEAEINVVWVYISYLRKKLSGLNSSVEIKAVRGVGYTLEEAKC